MRLCYEHLDLWLLLKGEGDCFEEYQSKAKERMIK